MAVNVKLIEIIALPTPNPSPKILHCIDNSSVNVGGVLVNVSAVMLFCHSKKVLFLQATFVIFIVTFSADVALTGIRAAKLLLKGAVQTPHKLYNTREFQKIGNLRTALRDFYAIRPQFIQKAKLEGGVSYYIIEENSMYSKIVKIVERKYRCFLLCSKQRL